MAVSKKTRRPKSKKKSFIPPKFLVGGIFLVFVFIITGVVISSRISNLKKQLEEPEKEPNYLSEIEKSIKTILFDHEISKESFKKLTENGKTVYIVNVPEESIYALSSGITQVLKRFGFAKQGDYFKDNSSGNLLSIKLIPTNHNIQKIDMKKDTKVSVNGEHTKSRKIAIILDDAGNSLGLAEDVLKLPFEVTLSVIPFTPFDKETADLVRRYKKELFLHLPMEPKSYPDTDPGKGAILLNTPESLVEIIVKKDIERLGKIDGSNNHMGSALTESSVKMKHVFNYLKIYTDTFVDSHTSKNSVAYDVCKNYMAHCGKNRIFIDNMNDYEYIKSKIDEGVKILNTDDTLIMIGHLKPVTVEVIKKYIPELVKKGIKLTTVKEVLSN